MIAQAFYVGVQIMCWTFIVQYAERLGFTKAEGKTLTSLLWLFLLAVALLARH